MGGVLSLYMTTSSVSTENVTYEPRRWVGLGLLICVPLVALAWLTLMYRQRAHPLLAARSVVLVTVSECLRLAAMLASVAYAEYVTLPKLECVTYFMATELGLIAFLEPTLVRIIRLHNQLTFSKHKLRLSVESSMRDVGMVDSSLIRKLQARTSEAYSLLLLALSFLPLGSFMIVMAIFNNAALTQSNCTLGFITDVGNGVFAFVHLTLYVVAIFQIRHIADGYFMRLELAWTMIIWISAVILISVCHFGPMRTAWVQGWYNPDWLLVVAGIANFTLAVILPTLGSFGIGPFSISRPRGASRTGTAEVTSGPETLHSVLETSEGLMAFSNHLVSEFSPENIQCWLALQAYVRSYSANTAAASANVIVQNFLLPSAPLWVNLPASIVSRTIKAVEAGDIARDTFDECAHEVWRLMEQDSFPRFMQSKLYAQYLTARHESRSQTLLAALRGVTPRLSIMPIAGSRRHSVAKSESSTPSDSVTIELTSTQAL